MRLPEVHTVNRPEELRLLAHPLRLRILESLIREALTTKQIAQRLGERPHRLYHHVGALARAGFIRLIRTRRVRGTVEKYYRATAKNFTVARDLVDVGPRGEGRGEELHAVSTALADGARSDFQRNLPVILAELERGREPILSRCRVRGTRTQIDRLRRRVSALLEACARLGCDTGDEEYALTLFFYAHEGPAEAQEADR